MSPPIQNETMQAMVLEASRTQVRAVRVLRPVAGPDQVLVRVCACADAFEAVGQAYDNFSQVTDADVTRFLELARTTALPSFPPAP